MNFWKRQKWRRGCNGVITIEIWISIRWHRAGRREEDIYSIVDTTFMPSRIECDRYSILGEIKEVICKKNRFTGEEIYDLKVECNDLYFRVGINKMDLLGEPLPGRRFKGKIWMMGTAHLRKGL